MNENVIHHDSGNIKEIEWYIDYIEFQQMLKHKENEMVAMDKDYIYMQMFNVIFKYIASQGSRVESSTGT